MAEEGNGRDQHLTNDPYGQEVGDQDENCAILNTTNIVFETRLLQNWVYNRRVEDICISTPNGRASIQLDFANVRS